MIALACYTAPPWACFGWEKDCKVQFHHVLVTAPDLATYKQRVIARARPHELPILLPLYFLPLHQRLLRHKGIYDEVIVH